jgi:undecaprenyl-diphosphatase
MEARLQQRSLAQPDRLVVHALLFVLLALACVALALVAHATPYFALDLTLTRALQTLRTPALDALAEALTWPGFPPQSNVLFGTLVLLLIVSRHFRAAAVEVLAAGGSAALWYAVAPLVDRPRPTPDLVYVSFQIPAGSFPSGHVLNLTAGFGFAWFLAYTLLPPSWWRTCVLWLVPAYLVLLGLSRVYTGQHWPSDVVGGYAFGSLWLWVCIWLYRPQSRAKTAA